MNKILTYNALLIVFVAISLGAGNVSAQNKKIADEVKKMTSDPHMKHASVSVSVYNITKNKEEYTYDADRLLSPASLMKIFTTACGFEYLGKNFRFKTSLGYTGSINRDGVLNGDLVLIGGGDPLLGSYRYRQTAMDTLFRLWFKALKKESVNGLSTLQDAWYHCRNLHGRNHRTNHQYLPALPKVLSSPHPACGATSMHSLRLMLQFSCNQAKLRTQPG